MNAPSTFERQAELLEQIHSCARELRELAGDALVITIEPAGRNGGECGPACDHNKASSGAADPPPSDRQARDSSHTPAPAESPGEDPLRGQVLEAFAAIEPATPTAIANYIGATGKRYYIVRDLVHQLVGETVLREAGQNRGHAIYARTPPDEPIQPIEPGPAATFDGERHHDAPPPVEESARRAADDVDVDVGEGLGPYAQVLDELARESGTVRELAERTGLPVDTVQLNVDDLVRDGHVAPCGERLPRRDVVYGAAG